MLASAFGVWVRILGADPGLVALLLSYPATLELEFDG
jgi:hypothetical protein